MKPEAATDTQSGCSKLIDVRQVQKEKALEDDIAKLLLLAK